MSEDQVARAKLRHELFIAMKDNTPRYQRAYRLAGNVMGALHDFLPGHETIRSLIHDRLIESTFSANAALISVPPEYDALVESQIVSELLKKVSTPPVIV